MRFLPDPNGCDARPKAGEFLYYRSPCNRPGAVVCLMQVKQSAFQKIKDQEAHGRMAALREARRSPQAAARLQRRASLMGEGTKWRITNFKEVARAMGKWV